MIRGRFEVPDGVVDGVIAVGVAAEGLSDDEIADRMVISPLTAKTHVNRAMIKLQARDRAQLVVLAYESGLVSPRAPGRDG